MSSGGRLRDEQKKIGPYTVVAWVLSRPDVDHAEAARKVVSRALDAGDGSYIPELTVMPPETIRTVGAFGEEFARLIGGIGLDALNAMPRHRDDRIATELVVKHVPGN